MLVIISDIHLTDGSSGQTINKDAFGVFRERLRQLAFDASWRSGKRYEPISQLELVLLGDNFDVIRSSKWLESTVHPWDDSRSESFAAVCDTITDGIVARNAEAAEIVRTFSDGSFLTLPPAADGKPDKQSKERQPISVRLHAMCGNHDWFYHLRGQRFDGMRKKLADAFGLANDPALPFPHEASESEVVQQVFRDHGVCARHGDIYDAFNFEEQRDASSLGDAIVIELLNRFPDEVERQMAAELPDACIQGLREIDNVRPLPIVPVWINGLLRRTCRNKAQEQKIKDIWDALADEFLSLEFVRERLWTAKLFGSVAKLEWLLKFSRGVSFGNLSEITSWISSKLASHDGHFYRNAFSEPSFNDRSSRFIVYGHTHHHEIVPLDVIDTASGALTQIYLNSGTWRAVHDQAQYRLSEQEFAGYHVMTYLAFFKGTERSGRTFETWSGTLGWRQGETETPGSPS